MKRKPTSPGEIIQEEFLKPLGLTQKDLSLHLGCDYKVINRIINEKASITPNMALRLASAFDTTPNFWLNAQIAVDLWKLQTEKTKKTTWKISSLCAKNQQTKVAYA